MKHMILIVLLLGSQSVAANEFRHWSSWTSREKSLSAAYVTAAYIDHRQTRVALRNGYTEMNPIYGQAHRDKSILINTVVMAAAYAAVGYSKPDELNSFLVGATLVRWGTVIHNDRIGISWRVAF